MTQAPSLFPAAHYTALQDHATLHPPPENLRNYCDNELGSELTTLTEEHSDTLSLKKNPSIQSSASPRTSLQRSIFLWWLEAACCILIICGLVGIIVALSTLNNQPLPQWPYGLTVNTFVAAFSVLIKAASGLVLAEGISHIKWTALRTPQPLFKFEVYDEASRGPWGALTLLWHDFGATVSSLGACIIILTLFLEPFSQQIVSFEDCRQVHEHQKATIPRTNLYGRDSHLPFDLRNMVYQGLYAYVQPQAAFACDTGNCTFSEQYSSLGVCSACEDVTSALNVLPYRVFTNKTDGSQRVLSWKVSWNDTGTTNQALSMISYSQYDSMTEDKRVSLVARAKPSIDIIRTVDGREHDCAAYSCSILPCIKSYTAEVERFTLKETLISEHVVPYAADSPAQEYQVADLRCVDDSSKQILNDMGYDLKTNKQWLPYEVTVYWNATTQRVEYMGYCNNIPSIKTTEFCDNENNLKTEFARLVPLECIYTMYPTAAQALTDDIFSMLFEGRLEQNFTQTQPSGPDPLLAMWYAGTGNGTLEDISGLMRNVADAVTVYMRDSGPKFRSIPVVGDVHYTTVCIHVRWPWMAYSISIVVLTLVFFAWMVTRTERDQSGLRKMWISTGEQVPPHDFKSSALPVLFHGFDGDSQHRFSKIGSTNKQEELRESSKDVKVQLVATDQGWRLSTKHD